MSSKFHKSQHRNLQLSLLSYLYDTIGALFYPRRVFEYSSENLILIISFSINSLTTFKKREWEKRNVLNLGFSKDCVTVVFLALNTQDILEGNRKSVL